MSFDELLLLAKSGDDWAVEELLRQYDPLLCKWAVINKCFDEDLYQELRIILVRCIYKYQPM